MKAEAPTVLIVEDESAIRKLIRISLAKAGFQILEAENGNEARDLVNAYPSQIRLVVLDIVMPGGNGLDFAVHLQNERPDATVLYVSGYFDSVAVESIARKNPSSILTKPFTREQLLERVHELIGLQGILPTRRTPGEIPLGPA